MNKNDEAFVKNEILTVCGSDYKQARFRRSGNGSINETWEIYGDGLVSLFLKLGRSDALDMYQQEAQGLELLTKAERFRIPKPLAVKNNDSCAFLLMEFIQLQPLRLASEVALGEALAEMHNITNEQFGWQSDNYIGRTPQQNDYHDEWWPFYCHCRLWPQLNLAVKNGLRGELADRIQRLIESVPDYFASHQPQPSLLHGDLWGGNVASDLTGTPVIYDPAVYFGDAETDIAMSQLFSPLSNAVYDVYYKNFPAKPGYELRQTLYDLYHLLNHYNLFGGSYLGQVERAVDSLLIKIL